MDTEVRLGKGRIEKDSKPKAPQSVASGARSKFNPLGVEIIKAFEEVDPKNKTNYSNRTERAACDFLIAEYGLDEVLKRIKVLPRTNKMPYFPSICTPYEFKQKWVKLEEAVQREREKKLSKSPVAFVGDQWFV